MGNWKTYSLERLLCPRSIAVIGANEKTSYAGKTLRNLIGNEFPGSIYPVNPTHSEVFGMKCYPSVTAIGEKVDLAIIIVKAHLVVDTIRECIDCGVGGILVITAGFRELDPVHGAEREAEIRALAEQSGVPVVGPNCIGFANIYNDMWACGISELPKHPLPKGNAAIISQSGAAGFGPLLSIARDRKIGLKYIISTGNESVLNICDYLEYCLDDPDIRAVSMLIEGLKDTERFMELARKARRLGKTLVVIKSGESEVGQRAAKSHTASMTGNMALFNAMTKQFGIIKADDYEELVVLAGMAQQENALKTRRVCVVSHSGGVSGCTGNQLGKRGFEVPVFSQETREHIDTYLKGFGSPNNPLDLTGQMRSPNLPDILLTAEKNEGVGAFVISSHGSGERFENILNAIRQVRVPVYFCWTGSMNSTESIGKLLDLNVPLSFSIQKMAVMLDKMVTSFESRASVEETGAVQTAAVLPDRCGMLNEPDAKQILENAGVAVPRRWMIDRREELPGIWGQVPEGKKCVLKIVSKTIIHKTDIGGVKLKIGSLEELEKAYDELAALREQNNEISGFVLEEMCEDGLDLVAGIRRDEQFGPVLMLGIGGIYTELFKLISIRILPMGRNEIESMIDEVPGLKSLLSGYRGHCGYDREALVSAVVALSDLVASAKDRVTLLEINPLRVLDKGKGVCALDCVAELK